MLTVELVVEGGKLCFIWWVSGVSCGSCWKEFVLLIVGLHMVLFVVDMQMSVGFKQFCKAHCWW